MSDEEKEKTPQEHAGEIIQQVFEGWSCAKGHPMTARVIFEHGTFTIRASCSENCVMEHGVSRSDLYPSSCQVVIRVRLVELVEALFVRLDFLGDAFRTKVADELEAAAKHGFLKKPPLKDAEDQDPTERRFKFIEVD